MISEEDKDTPQEGGRDDRPDQNRTIHSSTAKIPGIHTGGPR